MVEVTLVDERIIQVRLKHTPTVYALMDICETEVNEVFYAKLVVVLDQCFSLYTLIVLVDFSADRIGYQLRVYPHGSGNRNTNSSIFLYFERYKRLRIANSWCQRPKLHHWSWYSNAGGVVKVINIPVRFSN